MNRYLLKLSYIGTPFRGAQRQGKGGFPRPDDPTTIQGCLEMALKKLNPSNDPIVLMGSRTDAGVHALNAACHVDLIRSSGLVYQPKTVTVCLNQYFNERDIPIRVVQSYLTPSDFHCRYSAVSRTYLYRILITSSSDSMSKHQLFSPIEELHRSHLHRSVSFDINAMKEASKMFLGLHDFRTFKSTISTAKIRNDVTRKCIEYLKVEEVPQFGYTTYSWPQGLEGGSDKYQFVYVYIKATGFLYKQVRRIVGTLIAAAENRITQRDIKFMLEIPSKASWIPKIKTVPGHGLYLCDVEYPQDILDNLRA